MKLALLLIAFSGFFAARQPLMLLLRARRRGRPIELRLALWAVLYVGSAAAAGLALIIAYRLWLLVPLGLGGAALLALHLSRALELEDRTASSEFLAMAGLTLTAPASFYVATGRLDGTALVLWLAHLLYFTSSIFYVKMRVSFHARQKDPAKAARHCALYHASLVFAILMLAWLRVLPPLAIAAFAPIVFRAFWGMISNDQSLNLKRIGLAEIGYTAFFIALFALGWRAAQ